MARIPGRSARIVTLALATALLGTSPASAQTGPEPVSPAESRERDESERAEAAERRASEAERKASEALARAAELEARLAYDRTGFYLGGSAFYAPEAFDEESRLVVKSSSGASARLGYRFHPNLAADLRVDYLDGFTIRDGDAKGKLDGWAMTANLRFILFPQRLQPWMGMGVGVIRTNFKARFADGTRIDTKGHETDPIVRLAAGFDQYLTANLVLTVEAAMNLVTEDRDFINYGQLALGLDYRF